MKVYENRIASSFQAVDDAVHIIIDVLKRECNMHDKHLLFKVSFMLREILNNAVEHGNRFDPSKTVYCCVSYYERYLAFEIEDEGAGIPLSLLHSNTTDETLLRERQRGYETIKEMSFTIELSGSKVYVKFDLHQEA